jgi:hypothetical protein
MTTNDMCVLARKSHMAAACMLTVPIASFALVATWLGSPDWTLSGLGALGWIVALALRGPVAMLAKWLTSPERTRTILGWASGPAEELVRVGMVLLFVHTVTDAVWAGIGWGGIEVVFAAINAIAIAIFLTRDGPKAQRVQALMREREAMTACGWGWAAVERCSAMALHVGFTLLLFAEPWLVLATLVAHSLTNMVAVQFAKRSVVVTELALLAISFVILLCGLAANGVL